MNAIDILKYGQNPVLQAIDGLAAADWTKEGACGYWSVKDIVAHLASYEVLLVEVLGTLLDGGPTPYLDAYTGDGAMSFNDAQVQARSAMSATEVLEELAAAHEQTLSLVAHIPPVTRQQNGTLPWYGAEYALDDFIVYSYYGHKREHGAQIAQFRDTLKRLVSAS